MEVKEVYTPEDVEALDYERDLGAPGAYPFTRGPYPNMYRGAVVGPVARSPALAPPRPRTNGSDFCCSTGKTGISADFDHPTLTGYDSDHELAEGEVGRLGVAVDTVRDIEDLFDGIALDQVSVSLTINHPAIVILRACESFVGPVEIR